MTQLTYSLTEDIVGTAVDPYPTLQYDDSLSEVPSEDEI